MDGQPKPWDQLPEEPDRAYARFLVYRNLGPTRSVQKAYEQALEGGIDQNRQKSTNHSSTWTLNSTAFRWKERATAWDISTLSEVGQDVVVTFVQVLRAYAQTMLRELQDGRLKPRDFHQLTAAINTLGALIPAETVEGVQSLAGTGGVPALGAGSAGSQQEPD